MDKISKRSEILCDNHYFEFFDNQLFIYPDIFNMRYEQLLHQISAYEALQGFFPYNPVNRHFFRIM